MTNAVKEKAFVFILILVGFWVCFHNYKVMAIRIFTPTSKGRHVIGRRPSPLDLPAPAANFDYSKRRVPSSPDLLHNR